jgi:hypothetical protein
MNMPPPRFQLYLQSRPWDGLVLSCARPSPNANPPAEVITFTDSTTLTVKNEFASMIWPWAINFEYLTVGCMQANNIKATCDSFYLESKRPPADFIHYQFA